MNIENLDRVVELKLQLDEVSRNISFLMSIKTKHINYNGRLITTKQMLKIQENVFLNIINELEIL